MKTYSNEAEGLLGGDKLPYMQSPSLRFDKFVLFDAKNKKDQLDALISTYNKRPQFPEKFAFSKIAKSLTIVMQLASRLIINQAGGILENAGICLHRHFGYPYIPGSALKGIARHAAWCAWHDETDMKKKKDLALKIAFTFGFPTGDAPSKNSGSDRRKEDYLDEFLVYNFPDFFGKKKSYETLSGSVAFLPAYPNDKDTKLGIDIVNSHHSKYYAGNPDYKEAPDTESSNPQFFLAVEPNTRFVFTLAPIKQTGMSQMDTLSFAEQYLIEGLTQNGIGAKTAAGYGWFEVDEKAMRAREAEKEATKAIAVINEADVEAFRETFDKLNESDFRGKSNTILTEKNPAIQKALLLLLATTKNAIMESMKTGRQKKNIPSLEALANKLGVKWE